MFWHAKSGVILVAQVQQEGDQKVKKISSLTALFFCAIGLSGCSDAENESTAKNAVKEEYISPFSEKVVFELPAKKSYELRMLSHAATIEQGEMTPFTMPTGRWNLVYVANVWSDAGKPGVIQTVATDRSIRRLEIFRLLNMLRRDNHIPLEITFVQSDAFPRQAMADAEESGGISLSKSNGSYCGFFYGICVDHYVVSPFGSNAVSARDAQKKWLQPYMQFLPPERRSEDSMMMLDYQGFNNPNSDFWNSTPATAFLLNPDGIVVDAWIGVTSVLEGGWTPSSADIFFFIVENMGLDADSLKIPTDRKGVLMSESHIAEGNAVFGGTFLEIANDNLMNVFGEIRQAR